MIDHAGDVAGGKHLGVGHCLQRVGHLNEPVGIQREAGFAQPGRAAGARDPDDFVGVHAFRRPPCAGAVADTWIDLGIAAQVHAALGQHALERAAHRRIVGAQNRRAAGQQVEAQFVRIASQRAQFVAQAVLHRQRQLDAAGAAADHGDARGAGVLAHALEQLQPALVEAVDRLDRHGVLGRAGDMRSFAAWSRC